MSSQHHTIYERLADLCESYRLPSPVDFVPSGKDIFHSPEAPASVMAELAERFSEDDLLGSGVLVENGDGSLQLNPMLSDAESGFILLRDAHTGEVYDLLTIQGCITSRLPVLTALDDEQTRAALAHSEFLGVCFSFEDLAYLRSLGLPATAGAGMDKMSPEQLEAFCRAFEIELSSHLEDKDVGGPTVDPDGAQPDPFRRDPACQDLDGRGPFSQSALDARMRCEGPAGCQIVLVEWSPARMCVEPPPSVALVRSFLEAVDKHLDVDSWAIQTWSPMPEGLERIKFALEHHAIPWLRQAVSRDLEDSIRSLHRPQQIARVPAQDYVQALSALQQDLGGSQLGILSENRMQRLWREFDEKLDSDVINPMRSSALATMEPRERVLRLMFAELSRGLLGKLAVSNIKLSNDGLAEAWTHRSELGAPEEVKRLAMSVETVLKVAREIQRCNEATSITMTVVPTAPAVRNTPLLLASASPTTKLSS